MTGRRVAAWSTETTIDGALLGVDGWVHPDDPTAPEASVLLAIGRLTARMDTDQARQVADRIRAAADRADQQSEGG